MLPEKIFEVPQITAEEYKKYEGKNVAIYRGKIVAEGRTSAEAFKEAQRRCPKAKAEEIIIDYIQAADALIL